MNNEDTEQIREELREIRRLLVCLTKEVASIKLFVAAAGKPIETTAERAIKQVDDVARRTHNLPAFDVEDYNTSR